MQARLGEGSEDLCVQDLARRKIKYILNTNQDNTPAKRLMRMCLLRDLELRGGQNSSIIAERSTTYTGSLRGRAKEKGKTFCERDNTERKGADPCHKVPNLRNAGSNKGPSVERLNLPGSWLLC